MVIGRFLLLYAGCGALEYLFQFGNNSYPSQESHLLQMDYLVHQMDSFGAPRQEKR